MRELILWIIGLQKLSRVESALYTAIIENSIIGQNPAQVLNTLTMMNSIEEAEDLARSSGGLRIVRALFKGIQILKNLSNKEEIQKMADEPYPYDYLVARGGQLDRKFKEEFERTDLQDDDLELVENENEESEESEEMEEIEEGDELSV
jgi:hypothetical protein